MEEVAENRAGNHHQSTPTPAFTPPAHTPAANIPATGRQPSTALLTSRQRRSRSRQPLLAATKKTASTRQPLYNNQEETQNTTDCHRQRSTYHCRTTKHTATTVGYSRSPPHCSRPTLSTLFSTPFIASPSRDRSKSQSAIASSNTSQSRLCSILLKKDHGRFATRPS